MARKDLVAFRWPGLQAAALVGREDEEGYRHGCAPRGQAKDLATRSFMPPRRRLVLDLRTWKRDMARIGIEVLDLRGEV